MDNTTHQKLKTGTTMHQMSKADPPNLGSDKNIDKTNTHQKLQSVPPLYIDKNKSLISPTLNFGTNIDSQSPSSGAPDTPSFPGTENNLTSTFCPHPQVDSSKNLSAPRFRSHANDRQENFPDFNLITLIIS